MKKYLLINMMALAMVGCGGGGGSSSTPASSTPTSSAAASSVAPATWNLVWSDEFEGSNLDTTKWSFEKNCFGGGNNELQCYTDRADNAFLEGGNLHVVAKKEVFAGQAKGDDDPSYNPGDTSKTRDYTSARLRSKGKGDWTYGRMEIRAKMPKGQGLLPAIWMLPTEWKYGGWPSSGEIDIMESVNPGSPSGPNGNRANNVYGTLHYGTPWSYPGASIVPATNVWDDFHTYAIEWEAGTIRWYVDDQHYSTQISKNWFTNGSTAPDAPFDQKFHMILNLAVGGSWPGNPNADTTFPQEMTVDYVKVYNCSADTVTGKGCASHVDATIKPLPGTPKVAEGTLAATFDVFIDSVNSIWDTGLATYDNNSGAIKTSIINSDDAAHGKVINVKYGSTAGLAYIQTGTIKDASAFAKAGSSLQFDLKVINYGSATGINIKADCVYPCTSGDQFQGKIANGAWETITVPISTLTAGGLNLSRLNTPIGISPAGSQDGVELQIDNIRWVLGSGSVVVTPPTTGDITGSFDIFLDDVDKLWDNGLTTYNENDSGAIKTSIVDSDDVTHGKVANINYGNGVTSGLAYFQSKTNHDASVFATGGNIQFDVKVLSYGSADGLVIKSDCHYPCTSGDILIGKVADGVWETVKVPVSKLVTAGLKLNSVDVPFAIFPPWGKQAGVELQIDNVRWVK